MKYNLRLGKDRLGAVSLSNDFTHAKYLVLYAKGATKADIVFGITGDSEVVTRDELLETGYPEPGGKIYLTLNLTENIHPNLLRKTFYLAGGLIDTIACIPQIVKYVNILPPDEMFNDVGDVE